PDRRRRRTARHPDGRKRTCVWSWPKEGGGGYSNDLRHRRFTIRLVDAAHAARHNGAVQRSRLWLLPVLLAALVAGGWYFGFRAKESDRELPVYVTGAERMLAGEEIYRRCTDAKPFTYPPFAAVPFVPVTALPAAWQPPVWFGV